MPAVLQPSRQGKQEILTAAKIFPGIDVNDVENAEYSKNLGVQAIGDA
jgi:hypothetical protein